MSFFVFLDGWDTEDWVDCRLVLYLMVERSSTRVWIGAIRSSWPVSDLFSEFSHTSAWKLTILFIVGVGQVIKGWDEGLLGYVPSILSLFPRSLIVVCIECASARNVNSPFPRIWHTVHVGLVVLFRLMLLWYSMLRCSISARRRGPICR